MDGAVAAGGGGGGGDAPGQAVAVTAASTAPPPAAEAAPSSTWGQLALRAWHLLVISLMLIGAQVSYDSVGAVAPYLKRVHDIAGERLGVLYSAYHLPNVVMVFLGGVLIDAVGPDMAGVGLAGLVFVSSCIFAAATDFETMVAARIVLGIGGEALNVAQLALLNRAFQESYGADCDDHDDNEAKRGGHPASSTADRKLVPSIAVSYALSSIVARLGTLGMFYALPGVVETYGWRGMWLLAVLCGASVVFALLLLAMERGWLGPCCDVSHVVRTSDADAHASLPCPPLQACAHGVADPGEPGGGALHEGGHHHGITPAAAGLHALQVLMVTDEDEEGRPCAPSAIQHAVRDDENHAALAARADSSDVDDDDDEDDDEEEVTEKSLLLREVVASPSSLTKSTVVAVTPQAAYDNGKDKSKGACGGAAGRCDRCVGWWQGMVAFSRRVCTPALGLASAFLLTFSACIMPFGEICTDLYASVYGYDDQKAARTTSYSTIVGIVAMAPIGLVLDLKRWYHATLLVACAILVPPLVMLALAAPVPPEVMSCLIGLGIAGVGAAAWPMISLRVQWEVQGRVLGALTAGQNGIMVLAPIVVGMLRDRANAATLATGSGATAHDAMAAATGTAVNAAAAGSFAPAMWFLSTLMAVCVGLTVWMGSWDRWLMPRQVTAATMLKATTPPAPPPPPPPPAPTAATKPASPPTASVPPLAAFIPGDEGAKSSRRSSTTTPPIRATLASQWDAVHHEPPALDAFDDAMEEEGPI